MKKKYDIGKMLDDIGKEWLEMHERLDAAEKAGEEEYERVYNEIKENMFAETRERNAIYLLTCGLITFEDISEFTGLPLNEIDAIAEKEVYALSDN